MGNLVKIEETPVGKLLDLVNNTIGYVKIPWQNRDSKIETSMEQLQAIQSVKKLALQSENAELYSELTAMERRIIAKEEKRQKNIEKVIDVAAQSIKDEPNVTSEPVNPDWATRFFDVAQDISDETMQNLWGRILAGEVKCPKSYSLRTLDVLRNITCEEARLFEKVANYVMYDKSYFVYYDSSFRKNGKIDLTYEEIAKLTEIGLIQAGGGLVHAHLHNRQGKTITNAMAYGNYVLLIEQPSTYQEVAFPVYPLTKAGAELFQLIKVTPNDTYLKMYADRLKNDYKDLKVSYAKLIAIDYENDEYTFADETIQQL